MPLLGDALGGLVCRQALSAGKLYRSEGVDRLGETVYAIDRGRGENQPFAELFALKPPGEWARPCFA